METQDLRITADMVAAESAKISGVQPSQDRDNQREYDVFFELYKQVLGADPPRLTNPIIFNAFFCDTKGAARWRSGIPSEFTQIPKGEACSRLFQLWWWQVEWTVGKIKLLNNEEKVAYCDRQYCLYMCIRPFQNGSGRTGLLIRYMLQQYVGLPLKLVHYREAKEELFAKVRQYRKDVFIPAVRGKSFMLSH